MATATYVYCVVQSARKPSTAQSRPGCRGERAWTRSARIWVVHAPVPLDRYGTQAWERWDLEWVSAIAVAHEAVVEYFARLRVSQSFR